MVKAGRKRQWRWRWRGEGSGEGESGDNEAVAAVKAVRSRGQWHRAAATVIRRQRR